MRGIRRSRLRLVREIYIEVINNSKIHYLKERAYASESDGYIDVEEITKEKYLKAIEDGKNTEKVKFEDARLNIKNAVRKCS